MRITILKLWDDWGQEEEVTPPDRQPQDDSGDRFLKEPFGGPIKPTPVASEDSISGNPSFPC